MQNIWKIKRYDIVSSTNDVAKELSKDIKEPTVIVAETQTSGRGRRGNKWISKTGNLFFSQIFSSRTTVSNLAFVTSLSVVEAICNFNHNTNVAIKWPNDILIEDKKIAGILIENTPENNVILGIGVNIISNPDTSEISYHSTNLSANGITSSKERLLEEYLKMFDKNYALCMQNFELLRIKWLQYASHLDQKIKVKRKNNVEEGIFKGIDEQGLLLLEQDSKISKIAVAEVFF